MNQQNAKEYLPLVQALADGELQIQDEAGGWRDITSTCLSMPFHHYRRRPKPEMVPLGPEDVPPGCFLRNSLWRGSSWSLCVGAWANEVGFWLPNPDELVKKSYRELVDEDWEISRDGGKTWLKCEKAQ